MWLDYDHHMVILIISMDHHHVWLLFGWLWLEAGADLLWDKNIVGWLVVGADLVWEKNTASWLANKTAE